MSAARYEGSAMLKTLRMTSSESELGPTAEEVRAYMRFVLGRSEFDASERNRRFLSYVVEETLAGRADRIKAYSIATSVFDRTDDFDPLTDPIVRIEASRLRRSLEHYYLTAGRSDPIHIEIPKGSYATQFSYPGPLPQEPPPAQLRRELSPVPDGSPQRIDTARGRWNWKIGGAAIVATILAFVILADRTWERFLADDATELSRGPSIMVLPFENVGADSNQDFIARGLTYELINDLTRYSDLFVFGPETSFGTQLQIASSDATKSIKADYVLSGSVHPAGTTVKVSVLLTDSRTGQYIWSSDLERDLSTTRLLGIEADVAGQVARIVAEPYGVVFNRTAADIVSKPTGSLSSYECVVRFRQNWRNYDQREYGAIRGCLERAVETDPGYARAYSSLALLDVDTYRFGFGKDKIEVDPLQEAFQLSQRSIELDPDDSDGYLALAIAYWFSHDAEKSIATAKQGLAINPHNTDLLAELGFRYAFMERWDLSRPLMEEAFARNPAAPSGYRIANFLYYYTHGNYQAALNEALQVKATYVLYGHICRAMAYAQLGDRTNAAAAVAEILKIDPNYGDHVEADLAKRGISPGIIRASVEGLVKAGLAVRSAINNN